jgi:hypothetical protein
VDGASAAPCLILLEAGTRPLTPSEQTGVNDVGKELQTDADKANVVTQGGNIAGNLHEPTGDLDEKGDDVAPYEQRLDPTRRDPDETALGFCDAWT